MTQHAAFTAVTDIPVYFADPHSPWQRPTNENTNRLIREYLPKSTSFTTITDTQIQDIQDRLNRRPRIVLNGQTPTEKLNDIINGANTTRPHRHSYELYNLNRGIGKVTYVVHYNTFSLLGLLVSSSISSTSKRS